MGVKLLPVVDGIQPQSNKFATGVENEVTGDSKRNDSPSCRKWTTVKR